MISPTIRPATPADVIAFYGEAAPKGSIRGFVAVLDGQPIAIGGILYQGPNRPPFVFSEIKPPMKKFPLACVRLARLGLAELRIGGLMATANVDEPNAAKFLRMVGFHPVARATRGDVFQFRGAA